MKKSLSKISIPMEVIDMLIKMEMSGNAFRLYLFMIKVENWMTYDLKDGGQEHSATPDRLMEETRLTPTQILDAIRELKDHKMIRANWSSNVGLS